MHFFHPAKYLCSNYSLYKQKIEKLQMLFQNNAYLNWFINKIIIKFEYHNFNNTNNCNVGNTQEIEKTNLFYTIGVPYIEKPSHTFYEKLGSFNKK